MANLMKKEEFLVCCPTWLDNKLREFIKKEKSDINNVDIYNELVFEYSKTYKDYKYFFNNFKFYESDFETNDPLYKDIWNPKANYRKYIFEYLTTLLFNINNDNDLKSYYKKLKMFVKTNNIGKNDIEVNIDLPLIMILLRLRWFNKCKDEEFLNDNRLLIQKYRIFIKILTMNMNINDCDDGLLRYYINICLDSYNNFTKISHILMDYCEIDVLLSFIIIILDIYDDVPDNLLEEMRKIIDSFELIETTDYWKEKIKKIRNKYNLQTNINESYFKDFVIRFALNNNPKSIILYCQANELINIYDNNNVVDYSNICLQYCRVLEITIKTLIIEPIIKDIGTSRAKKCIEEYNYGKPKEKKIKIYDFNRAELGTIRKLFVAANGNEDNELLNKIRESVGLEFISKYVDALNQQKLDKFRNPPAHTGLASRKTSLECKKWVDATIFSIYMRKQLTKMDL